MKDIVRKKVIWKLTLMAMVTVLGVLIAFPGSASAYFNWGTVGVSVGSGSVTLGAGESAKVSVSVNPASMEQLPGCGMAECPQTCGDKDCLDARGQCVCGGGTYKTYYTSVSVKSSDSSIAAASYSGGALTITGKSAGSALITVTADLRQWSPGSTRVKVTVTAPPATTKPVSTTAKPTSTTKKPATSTSKPATATTKKSTTTIKGSTTTEKSTTTIGGPTTTAGVSVSTVTSIDMTSTSGGSNGTTSMTTPDGRVFVQVPLDGTMARAADFQTVAGQDAEVTFFTGDSVGNVEYSWTFKGTELPPEVADLDLGISVSTSAGGDLAEITQGNDCLFLNINHSGPLPAEATVYLRVNEVFADGTALTLYHYDPESGEIVNLNGPVTVVDGYVNFAITECSILILSPSNIARSALSSGVEGANAPGVGMGGGLIALAVVVPIVVVLIAAFLVWRFVWLPRRLRTPDETGDQF